MIDNMIPGDPLDAGWAHSCWHLQCTDAIFEAFPGVSLNAQGMRDGFVGDWLDAKYDSGLRFSVTEAVEMWRSENPRGT